MLWQGGRTDLRATMTGPGPSQSLPGYPSAQHRSFRGTLQNLLQRAHCQTVQALGVLRVKNEHDAIDSSPQWRYGVWTGTWTGHSARMGMENNSMAGYAEHLHLACGH